MTAARRLHAALPGLALAALVACGGAGGDDGRDGTSTTDGLPADAPPGLVALEAKVRAAPDDVDALRDYARALHDHGARDEALAAFEAVAARRPDADAFLDLGLVHTAGGRLDEAAEAYRRALAERPDDPVLLHNMGNVAYQRGDYGGASQLYNRAVQSRPDYLLAWLHLGDAFRMGERYREAYRCYERAAAIEPRDARELEAGYDALYRLASLDLQMGAVERAASYLEELVRQAPAHPKAHYALGQAYLQLDRPAEAEAHLRIHAEMLDDRPVTSPAAMEER